jgi:Helix-turn-helix domain
VHSILKCDYLALAMAWEETQVEGSYQHFSLEERRTLFRLLNAKLPIKEIAAQLGRHRSTIYREIARNEFREVKQYRGYYVPCDMPLEGGVELRER